MEEEMSHLQDLARAGEFCIHEAILTALAQQPEKGLSVREIAIALGLSGKGCEKMIESHLKHRLKNVGKVRLTRKPHPEWVLTAAERARRRG